MTGVSSQEEADTLMMPHALELVGEQIGNEVDFFTQDTDWWVLLLCRHSQLGPNTAIVNGSKETRKRILLKPIYDALGPSRAAALPGMHSITGTDTTGPISGVGKHHSKHS